MALESSCCTHDWYHCFFILSRSVAKSLSNMEDYILDEFQFFIRQIHYRSYYYIPWLGKHVFLELFPYSSYNFIGDNLWCLFSMTHNGAYEWVAFLRDNKSLMFINIFLHPWWCWMLYFNLIFPFHSFLLFSVFLVFSRGNFMKIFRGLSPIICFMGRQQWQITNNNLKMQDFCSIL